MKGEIRGRKLARRKDCMCLLLNVTRCKLTCQGFLNVSKHLLQKPCSKSIESSSQVTTNASDAEPTENTPISIQTELDSPNMASPERPDGELTENESTNDDEQSLVIMLDNIKTDEGDKNVDIEKEEMQRAIVNINRKTRPLIKHVNVGNKDVLHISIDDKEVKHKTSVKNVKSAIVTNEQVSNWEDLLSEEDEISGDVTEQVNLYTNNFN